MSLTVAFAALWCLSTVQRSKRIILLERRSPKRLQAKRMKVTSSGEPSLNFTETFKLYFQGPRFTVGNSYFDHSKGQTSQFECHVGIVIKSFNQNFVPRTENGLRDKYLATISSNNWNKLTSAEKAAHSLSNCQACALNSPKEQKSFPLKPTFIVHENDHVTMKSFIEKDYQDFNSLCKQRTGQPFADLVNKFPQKLGLRDTDAEVKAAKQVIRVKKLVGLPPPALELLGRLS